MKLSRLMEPGMGSFAVQRLLTWQPLRFPLADWLASRRPAHAVRDPDAKRLAEEARRDGIAFLPGYLDAEEVGRIHRYLDGLPLDERFASRRQGFQLDAVPDGVHVAEYRTADIVRCPDVLNIANDPRLVDAAALYLGCKPTISNLSIWWSLPANDGTAQEAENYHRDVDDWRFIKFFLYLTNVDDDAGPHRFVKKSHHSRSFLRVRRIRDEEVEQAFPSSSQLSIDGIAGDAFLEDTFGLHKGQPPLRRRRLLLQVQYSINPIAVYKYTPARQLEIGGQLDPYINRLYLKS